jgi:hypothetical protein
VLWSSGKLPFVTLSEREYYSGMSMSRWFKVSASAILVLAVIFSFEGCSSADKVKPPWDAPTIGNEPKILIVKVNQQFVVKYEQISDMFPIMNETHDENMASLLDTKTDFQEPSDQAEAHSITWYLFKALRKGEVTIHVTHSLHLGGGIEERIAYRIKIID